MRRIGGGNISNLTGAYPVVCADGFAFIIESDVKAEEEGDTKGTEKGGQKG
jgi:hypothetical protein